MSCDDKIYPVSVSGFRDNRGAPENESGQRVPLVHLMQSSDCAYNLQSIGMTPAQARHVANAILAAADSAELGHDYDKEEIGP